MFELDEILKDANLDKDPNGILAKLVDAHNEKETSESSLTQTISTLQESVKKLEQKNKKDHVNSGDRRDNLIGERDTALGELGQQRADFDTRYDSQRKEYDGIVKGLNADMVKLGKESKAGKTLQSTLETDLKTAKDALGVFQGKELTREKHGVIGALVAKSKVNIHSDMTDVVYNQITPFMQKGDDGKFKVANSEGNDIPGKDGKAIGLSDLLNDVGSDAKYVEKAYPSAFMKPKGNETIIDSTVPHPLTPQTARDSEARYKELSERLDI